MTQDLREKYQDYKKLRVVEAAELIRDFLWDNGVEETGLDSYDRSNLRDYLGTLCDTLLRGHKPIED